MRRLIIALGVSSILLLTVPALAGMVVFQATAPLRDHSDFSVETAIPEAIQMGIRSAAAMGLPWVKVGPPLLSEDRVTVEILATDDDPDSEEETGPQPGGQYAPGGASSEDSSGDEVFL